MSKEVKNEVVDINEAVEVDVEEVASAEKAAKMEKVKTIGKKVGKIALAVLAVGGAFFLGTKIGKGGSDDVEADDYVDDDFDNDSDMEDEVE